MVQLAQTMTFSDELLVVVKLLASSKNQAVSRFVENELRDVPIIKETLHRLEKIPDLPPMIKGNIPYSTIEEDD